jgi:hypothetical protein
LERLLIDVTTHADATDHRSAIDISFTASGDYTGMGVLTLNDVEIRTDSVGLRVASNFTYATNLNILFKTTKAHAGPVYGVLHEENGRFWWFGGKCGTGYGLFSPPSFGEADLIGYYIPPTATGGNLRGELHDITGFIVNESETIGKLNNVRAENGWVRCFGCFGQCEDPNAGWNANSLYAAYGTSEQPASGEGGKIETFGCRYNGHDGALPGGTDHYVAELTDADDGYQINVYTSGVILADTTSFAFGLVIEDENLSRQDKVHIKNVGTGGNSLTISPPATNGTIDGSTDDLTLSDGESVYLFNKRNKEWFTL